MRQFAGGCEVYLNPYRLPVLQPNLTSNFQTMSKIERKQEDLHSNEVRAIVLSQHRAPSQHKLGLHGNGRGSCASRAIVERTYLHKRLEWAHDCVGSLKTPPPVGLTNELLIHRRRKALSTNNENKAIKSRQAGS